MPQKYYEKDLVKAVLDYLHLLRADPATGFKVKAWRNNTGGTMINNHFVRYGFKGSSDILGIMPDGRFLAIECKLGKAPLTPEQQEFISWVRERGGVAIIARSLNDVIRVI